MSIKKEFCKIFFKLIDTTAYTDFFPKIINRNSSTMNKNDYKVSDEYDYIFVHVHRTGGASFRSVITKINKEMNGKKIFPGNHNPMTILHPPLEKKYITVLRDPVERVYSYYNVSLSDKKQPYHYLAKKNIFHFLKYCPEAQNLYCKYFSADTEKDINNDLYELAIKNLKNFDTIIKFINYNNDMKKFLGKINIDNIEVPHINTSPKKRKISDEELKAIKFYNDYDIKLYNRIET